MTMKIMYMLKLIGILNNEKENKSCDKRYIEKKLISNWNAYLNNEVRCFNLLYKSKLPIKVSLNDFKLIKTVGTGTFGRVILSFLKITMNPYAIKVLTKQNIIKAQQIQNTLNEKRILQSIKFSFTIHMEYFFKDNSNIYFVVPYIEGGELFDRIKETKYLSESDAIFYSGQVILAFEYLHYLGLVYRDLKPENLLLDREGYLKLVDFGFSKLLKGRRTYSICGTEDYLAPEVILQKGHFEAVDWWALGVLIYEMCAGFTPFMHTNKTIKYSNICKANFKMLSMFSTELKDLIYNLLQPQLSKRLGNLKFGADDIKRHIWFKEIDWLGLVNKEVNAPFIPNIKSYEKNKEEEIFISKEEEYLSEFEDF